LLWIALALLCIFAAHAKADADAAIDVGVRVQGGEVFVDVSFHVRATPQEAWAVMTDYYHATAFISKLEKSVILSRTDETLLVSQKGTMGYGPFSVRLETVTEIHLTPFKKMQRRMVSGNMKKKRVHDLAHCGRRWHARRASPGIDSGGVDAAAHRARPGRARNARALSPARSRDSQKESLVGGKALRGLWEGCVGGPLPGRPDFARALVGARAPLLQGSNRA